MAKRKPTNKYYFSVEGETEQWYLKWLQDTINNTEKAACKVSIDCPVRKNPLKHAKSLTVTRKIEIYHFFDYESDEPLHVKGFQEALCHIGITPSPLILQQPVDCPMSAHYKEMVLLPDGYSQLPIHSPLF